MENTKKDHSKPSAKNIVPSFTKNDSIITKEKTSPPPKKEANKERSFKEGLGNNSDTEIINSTT